MLKKFLGIILVVSLVGCASIHVPQYIKNDHPYKKKFYLEFKKVLPLTVKSLEESGWTIEQRTDPEIYERRKGDAIHKGKQLLLITGIRKLPIFIASRYARLNVYVTSEGDDSTEVEIRYVGVKSLIFKNFYDFTHEDIVERVLRRIENNLRNNT